MDKIYEALRKIASETVEAQTTNSEYFKVGNIEIRVSDHTKSGMSTVDPFKMHILTGTGKRNLYTVCYGQDVKICTFTEVKSICTALSLLAVPLSRFFNRTPNQTLLAKKSVNKTPSKNSVKKAIRKSMTVEEQSLINAFTTGGTKGQRKIFVDHFKLNLYKLSDAKIKELVKAFNYETSCMTYQQRVDRLMETYKGIDESRNLEVLCELKELKDKRPIDVAEKVSKITECMLTDLNPQQKSQIGKDFIRQFEVHRNAKKAAELVLEKVALYRDANEKRKMKIKKLLS